MNQDQIKNKEVEHDSVSDLRKTSQAEFLEEDEDKRKEVRTMEEDVVEEHDRLILEEIKRLMDELKESYAYVEMPTELVNERMVRSSLELKKHVKGKLEDLIEFIDNGVFW